MSGNLGDRTKYLGASEAGIAAGLSPWKTRTWLWEVKTGRRSDEEHRRVFDRGNFMEPEILRQMEEDCGCVIVDRQGEYATGERPWLKSHVDGVIESYVPAPGRKALENATGRGVVECKAPGSNMIRTYREDGLTADNIVQLQLNMYNAGDAGWGRYGVFDYDEWRVVQFDILRDDAFLAKLLPRLDDFWDCVQSNRRPEEYREALPVPVVDGDLRVLADPDLLADAENYVELRRELAHLEIAVKDAKGSVMAHLPEDAGLVQVGDILRISHKWQKGRTTTDTKMLLPWVADLCAKVCDGDFDGAHAMAENYDLRTYTREGSPFRVFRPTPIGDWKGAWK